MDNFLEYINDEEAFKQNIKDHLDKATFMELDDMKKEMANEFLTGEEE